MSGVDIDPRFNDPYFTGAGPDDDSYGLPVSIDGRGFNLDLASEAFSRRSVQLLNTQQAQSGLDQSVTSPEVWRRPVDSWHMGADQTRYDRDESLPYRYHQSVGIDPWNRYGFELLPETTLVRALAANEKALLKSIGRSLYVAVGASVWEYADLLASMANPVEATQAAPVIGLCADGENVYALLNSGVVRRRTPNGAWADFATIPAFNASKAMIAYVKGFVLVGNGPDLLNVTSGAPVLVYKHPLAGWWWRSACEGLSVIYVLGGMGDRWHVHRVSIKATGADLDPPIVASTLPEGEYAYAIASYLGYVLIGVNSGWRFGMPDGSGNVTYGQLVPTNLPVLCFEGQDRFVWFGMSKTGATARVLIERVLESENAGIGRADLSTFIAPMTPAAASDLAGSDLGVTRDVVSVGAELDGIGKRVFSVDGVGVFIEADTLVRNGWLTQGKVSFNSTDPKMGLYAQVYHEPLRGEVHVEVANESDGVFMDLGMNDTRDSTTLGNMPYPQKFDSLEMRLTLHRDSHDHTRGPRITRTEFRAINIPGRATEWRIPLIVHESQNYADVEFSRDVPGDYDFLVNLVQSRRAFTYREGERRWILHATDFLWTPYKMTANGAAYQGTFLLIARETR